MLGVKTVWKAGVRSIPALWMWYSQRSPSDIFPITSPVFSWGCSLETDNNVCQGTCVARTCLPWPCCKGDLFSVARLGRVVEATNTVHTYVNPSLLKISVLAHLFCFLLSLNWTSRSTLHSSLDQKVINNWGSALDVLTETHGQSPFHLLWPGSCDLPDHPPRWSEPLALSVRSHLHKVARSKYTLLQDGPNLREWNVLF